jgi:hypothetical protein
LQVVFQDVDPADDAVQFFDLTECLLEELWGLSDQGAQGMDPSLALRLRLLLTPAVVD